MWCNSMPLTQCGTIKGENIFVRIHGGYCTVRLYFNSRWRCDPAVCLICQHKGQQVWLELFCLSLLFPLTSLFILDPDSCGLGCGGAMWSRWWTSEHSLLISGTYGPRLRCQDPKEQRHFSCRMERNPGDSRSRSLSFITCLGHIFKV